jgi:hypothetical protein
LWAHTSLAGNPLRWVPKRPCSVYGGEESRLVFADRLPQH